MNLNSIRNTFKPLFEADRSELTARLLHWVMRATIVIVGLVLLFDVSQGGWIPNARSAVLIGLLVEQLVLLFILRSGHVNVVAFITLASFWGAMTYGAWIAGGVYDLSVFVYMVVILAAALLTTWRVSIFFSILSIVSIWGLTIAETRGYLVPTLDSPLSRARDLTTIFLFLAVLIFLLINVLRQALEKIQEDFHERLQAEQALRAGEERFRRIFHASPIAIAISNLEDGRLLDANEAYWKLTGFAPHRSLDHTTVELGIWEDEASRQAFVDNLLKQGALHDPAYEFTRDDGERKIATAYYEVVEFGGRSAILSIFHDVTSQKQAQEALFRSEARIRAMFEAIPDMMFELNPNGVMLQFLPSMSMRPIMPPEEFIGKTVAEALPFIAEQTAFAIRRTLESRQVQAFEYQLEQDGEIRTFEARLIATETDTVLSMVRDVTLIKWAFSEREKLISELESKNAELERFVYTEIGRAHV